MKPENDDSSNKVALSFTFKQCS